MSDSKKEKLSRRSFVKNAGGTILASSLVASLAEKAGAQQDNLKPNEKLPPEKRVGWAIVGLGDFGTKQIIPNFADCKRSKLVALVSGDRAKAEKYASDYGVNPKNI